MLARVTSSSWARTRVAMPTETRGSAAGFMIEPLAADARLGHECASVSGRACLLDRGPAQIAQLAEGIGKCFRPPAEGLFDHLRRLHQLLTRRAGVDTGKTSVPHRVRPEIGV